MHVSRRWEDSLSSCRPLKQQNPTAPSGVYSIDPTGGGQNTAFKAYCDMTTGGGGWTLIQDSGAGTPPASLTLGLPVLNGVAGAMPLVNMQQLANAATQIHVRTTGQQATRSFTTVAGSTPIVNLRLGNQLNISGYSLADYTGPFATGALLNFSCAPSAANVWPSVYHACGNASGLHIVTNRVAWVFNQADEAMQVYVR